MKRVAGVIVSVALVVTVFWFVLPQIADLSEVWTQIRAMTPLELSSLAIAAAWNVATYLFLIVAATPGLTNPQAFVMTEATTAVSNTVPGGAAVSLGMTYAMLGSWGFSRSRSTLSVVVSGLWDNFVKLGLPVVALALLAFQGQAGGARLAAGMVGIAVLVTAITVFAFALRSDPFARRAGDAAGRIVDRPRRLVGRPPVAGWGDATAKLRARVVDLVRTRWVRLTVTAVVSHLSLFLVLVLALRHVGVSAREVSTTEALAVFAFVRLISAIPLTPGGLGIVELALIGGLSSAGGDHAQVVAAVLVYRLLTYVLPILLGVGAWVFWRRNRSWLGAAPPLELVSVPASGC
jgi:uncharacterized protein (TIRG00374 family)